MSIIPAKLVKPAILEGENADQAVALLQAYMDGTSPSYSGAHFEKIGLEWARPGDVNDVTPADLVALATLSVEVKGSAAVRLLNEHRAALAELLAQVPADLDLVDAGDDVIGEGAPLDKAWKLIRNVPSMGPTRTSKLLARKRPRLVPVYDSVVRDAFHLKDSAGYWAGFRDLLQSGSPTVHDHALALREQAEMVDRLSVLRVIDIVVWMDAKRGAPAESERPDEE